VQWIEIRFEVPRDDAECLSEALEAAGALAVGLEDARDEPLYEPAPGSLPLPLWSLTRLVALFEDGTDVAKVLKTLSIILTAGVPTPVRIAAVEERDWQRECQENFTPQLFADRLWVCRTWHRPPDGPAKHVILDPGLAFGTGSHPTTALCLEWLAARSLERATVVDYGCGSGILGIGAARLGADVVWAVDIDSQALTATAENARLNGVAGRMCVAAPEALSAVIADVVVANILASPLTALARRFARLLRTGGRIALSGILEAQAAGVQLAYEPWFSFGDAAQREGWVRLQGVRR
jgi:ribosomal protein L11 methyltransferase